MARRIVVEVVGDASSFNKTTDGAVKKAQGLSSNLKTVGKGMVIGAGIGAFNLLNTAMSGAVQILGDARQAFIDDQLSQVLLGTALKNNIPNWDGNVKGVEAYAGAQGRLGFTDDEVRASIGQLVGVTHSLTEAQQLNSLAQDLARAKGIDLAQATDIVTKAHEGNGKALKSLGIQVGAAKTGAELLDAVQKNVKGSAEEWAKTSTGKTKVSQVAVGEAMEKIGKIIDKVAVVVIPALANAFVFVADVVATVFPYIERVIKAVYPVIASIFGGIGKVVHALGPVFQGVADTVGAVFGGITATIKGAMNTVIGIINGVIRGINGIQFHIHAGPVNADFNGLGLGYLPTMHSGGRVPGAIGANVPAMLQAGEHVIPLGGGGSQTINVNIASFIGSDREIDRFTDRIAMRLKLRGI